MKALLPQPAVSAALFATWLLLAGEVAPASLLLATAVAVLLPLAVRRMPLEAPALRGPAAAARLAVIVLWDIVVANLIVARLVLGPLATLRPAFVEVPLGIADPFAVSLLATIVTMTPGTVSCQWDEARATLLVHALHAPDPAAVAADIKARYETPLKEIFRC